MFFNNILLNKLTLNIWVITSCIQPFTNIITHIKIMILTKHKHIKFNLIYVSLFLHFIRINIIQILREITFSCEIKHEYLNKTNWIYKYFMLKKIDYYHVTIFKCADKA